jgi:hypothetical protein
MIFFDLSYEEAGMNRRPALRRAALAAAVLVTLSLGARFSAGQKNPEPAKYHPYAELATRLQAAVQAHPDLARIESAGRTFGGRDVWVVELANRRGAPPETRPALLVAATFEGDHLVGSEIALAVVESLVGRYPADPEIKKVLDESVIYIVPRVNPDGAEGFFAPLQAGRRTALAPRDEDNDGRVDEDGPEDLNGDGLVTLMRVKASDGEYIADPEEPRLMRKADPKKGERGEFKIYSEGVDNDGDGFINEDPVGGTDLNRNFMHEYPYYQPDAGPHMVSEAESRAFLDWLLKHRNVAAILTFGESDNLVVAPNASGRLGPARELDLARFADASNAAARTAGTIPAGGPAGFGRRGMGEFSFEMMGAMMRPTPPAAAAPAAEGSRFRMPDRKPATTIATPDVDYFKAVAEKYGELTGIRQLPAVREPQGAFFQYGYYQFGVPSFSTPGFGLGQAEAPSGRRPGAAPAGGPAAGGQASGQTGPPGERPSGAAFSAAAAGGGGQAARGEFMRMMQGGGAAAADAAAVSPGIDRQVLKWLDQEKIDGFVAWTKVKHPAFGEVEVGGFKPYAIANPPAARLAELGAAHVKFVLYLASLAPRIRIASTEVANLGGGVFRVKAEVENAGYFPTALAHAVTSRSVKPTLVQLGVKPEEILSGNPKTNFIAALAGSGGRARFEWLIRGKTGETIELRAVSEKAGLDTARIVLK